MDLKTILEKFATGELALEDVQKQTTHRWEDWNSVCWHLRHRRRGGSTLDGRSNGVRCICILRCRSCWIAQTSPGYAENDFGRRGCDSCRCRDGGCSCVSSVVDGRCTSHGCTNFCRVWFRIGRSCRSFLYCPKLFIRF